MNLSMLDTRHLDETQIEKAQILTEESLKDLTPLNCRVFFQGWEPAEWNSRSMPVQGPIDLFWFLGQSEEIKTGLVSLFSEFCKTLKEADESTKRSSEDSSEPQQSPREKEMKWIENNKELLATLSGKWIALADDQLIASSSDFEIVLNESKAKGIGVPFIVFVPEPSANATIGI